MLGGGFRPRVVRRGGRYQLLWGLMLARHLSARGIEVLEVERPERRRRSSHRNREKSDPSDAERAARAVLAREASGVPKSGEGCVEMIRALQAARRPPSRREPKPPKPAAGIARDGTGGSAPPFAQPLDEGARLGGHALPHRR